MKKIILSLLVLCSFSFVQAQIDNDDFNDIFPLIKAEKWKKAYKEASESMGEVDANDNSENAKLMRYALIYSATGMVKEGDMTFLDMQNIVDGLIGKSIVSPYYVGSMNPQNTLNKTMFTNFDGVNKGFTTVTNSKGKILFYVEYDFVNDITPRELHGTMVSCEGEIKGIELNPENKTDWILKINVAKASIVE